MHCREVGIKMFGYNPPPIESSYPRVSGEKIIKKHRILFVGPHQTLGASHMPLPIEAFQGGYLCEVCSWESLVFNANDWKNEVDVIVINTQSELCITNFVTGAQVKTAITTMMSAGVKLILFLGDATYNIRFFAADGTYTSTSLASLLGGLSSGPSKNFSAQTGTFQHSDPYPFGTTEILQSGIIPSTSGSLDLIASDPLVVFPVNAVQGEVVAKMVAYKPNSFFVVAHGGGSGATASVQAYWKYVKSNVLIDILLGKDNNARLALDAQNGRKIAALGVDLDVTTDLAAVQSLHESFGSNIPMEWGLVADNVTDDVAGFYRGLPGITRLVSHTKSHYNTVITVTDELHTIPSNQLVRLNRPFKVMLTSVKTVDDVTTFTRKTGDIIRTGSDVGKYVINGATDIGSVGQLLDGYLKFNSVDVGKQLKITYTCSDEAAEVIGSLNTLKAKGALTKSVVYTTMGAHSVEPSSLLMAEEEGVIIADYLPFPSYSRAWHTSRTQKKMPFMLGTTLQSVATWNSSNDSSWYQTTKTDAKVTYITDAITRCNSLDIPYVFYMHDFPISETALGGAWLGAGYADWKKASYEETKAYLQEMYTWVIAQLVAQNPFWMTRGEYVERYYYLNKYLSYDIVEANNGYKISVKNNGRKDIKGITLRLPFDSDPTVVRLLNGADVFSSYTNGVKTVWFDLVAGSSSVLMVH